MFKSAPVRDANRADFDPAPSGVDDIYGSATLPGMAANGAMGAMGLEALRRIRAGE